MSDEQKPTVEKLDDPESAEVSVDLNIDEIESEEVKELINKITGKSTGIKEANPGENKGPKIPKDTTFDNAEEQNIPAFVDPSVIEVSDKDITETDKKLFLKAVLNDDPVTLTVSLMKGQFNVTIRSKSIYEQKIVQEAVKKEKPESFQEALKLMQYFSCALMLVDINQSLNKFKLEGKSVEKDVDDLIKYSRESIEAKYSGPRWGLIVNAFSMFEGKVAFLLQRCSDSDFW